MENMLSSLNRDEARQTEQRGPVLVSCRLSAGAFNFDSLEGKNEPKQSRISDSGNSDYPHLD